MSIPDRIVTHMELRRGTGERGARKLIAFDGIVYDVTDCPKWRTDLHEQLHFPGQDLTSELPTRRIRRMFFQGRVSKRLAGFRSIEPSNHTISLPQEAGK
jgi:predicted heme/steroid binding protein